MTRWSHTARIELGDHNGHVKPMWHHTFLIVAMVFLWTKWITIHIKYPCQYYKIDFGIYSTTCHIRINVATDRSGYEKIRMSQGHFKIAVKDLK